MCDNKLAEIPFGTGVRVAVASVDDRGEGVRIMLVLSPFSTTPNTDKSEFGCSGSNRISDTPLLIGNLFSMIGGGVLAHMLANIGIGEDVPVLFSVKDCGAVFQAPSLVPVSASEESSAFGANKNLPDWKSAGVIVFASEG